MVHSTFTRFDQIDTMRRQKINQLMNVHLVQNYRQRGLHLIRRYLIHAYIYLRFECLKSLQL